MIHFLLFQISFFLIIITNVRIIKTHTSFRTFSKIFIIIMTFLFINKVFNIRQVSYIFFFLNSNIKTSYKEILIINLVLEIFFIKTSILIFFISLVDKRLVFTIYISKKILSRLIFVKIFNISQQIFVVFFGQFLPLKTPSLNFISL